MIPDRVRVRERGRGRDRDAGCSAAISSSTGNPRLCPARRSAQPVVDRGIERAPRDARPGRDGRLERLGVIRPRRPERRRELPDSGNSAATVPVTGKVPLSSWLAFLVRPNGPSRLFTVSLSADGSGRERTDASNPRPQDDLDLCPAGHWPRRYAVPHGHQLISFRLRGRLGRGGMRTGGHGWAVAAMLTGYGGEPTTAGSLLTTGRPLSRLGL